MNDKPTDANATLPAMQRHVPALDDVFANQSAFELAQRVAKVFAASQWVPAQFRGNVPDCLIALQIARTLNENTLTVMQSVYIVNGRPGWSTAYMISRANRSGVFSGRISWDVTGTGDALSVTAKAVLADTGEEIRVAADMRMAKAEGWAKNAKYTSMPVQMLRWRSAAMLIRLYAPEVMFGMPTREENETLPPPPMRNVTPRSAETALDDFAAKTEAAAAARAAVQPIETSYEDAQAVTEQPAEPEPGLDLLATAEERGLAAHQAGHRRRAMPGEYRDPERALEAEAWLEGWDRAAGDDPQQMRVAK